MFYFFSFKYHFMLVLNNLNNTLSRLSIFYICRTNSDENNERAFKEIRRQRTRNHF